MRNANVDCKHAKLRRHRREWLGLRKGLTLDVQYQDITTYLDIYLKATQT